MKLKRTLSTILLLSLLFALLVGCARALAEEESPAADAPTAAVETTKKLRGQKTVETRATTVPKRGLPTEGLPSRLHSSDVPLSIHGGFKAYLTDAQVEFVDSVYTAEDLLDFEVYEYKSYTQKAWFILSRARRSVFYDVYDANKQAQACGSDAVAKYEALKSRSTKTLTYELYGQKLEDTDYEVEILYENDLLIGAVVVKVGANGERTLVNTGSDAFGELCPGDNLKLFETAVSTMACVPEFEVKAFAIVKHGHNSSAYVAPVGMYCDYGYLEFADSISSWFEFYTFAPERFATIEEGRAILAKQQ